MVLPASTREAILPVIDALEDLGIAYRLCGSFASSIHGVPRATLDLDIVASIGAAQATALVLKLEDAFFAEVSAIRSAIANRGSFNILHPRTGFKIDVFIDRAQPFDRIEALRLAGAPLFDGRVVPVISAEDTILRKLQWFDQGGRVSDRQWKDILGILEVQGSRIDLAHLERWAGSLGVGSLLRKALAEAPSGDPTRAATERPGGRND